MMLSVTFIDFLIVLVIVVSAAYAAWRGFISETLTIFEWIAAAFACLYIGPYLIPMMRSLFSQPWLASLLAYASVFLAVFIPLAFLSHRISEGVKNSPIGPLDRAAGLGFGILRGLVIVGLAYLAFTYFVPIREHPRWLTQAELLPMVQNTSEVLLSVVPEQPTDFAFIPSHRERPSGKPAESPRRASSPSSHDPMAELIRANGDASRVSKTTREPVQQKSAGAAPKSYGAADRKALDTLIETGGSGTR
jgi:membrane protein required for colicin V production